MAKNTKIIEYPQGTVKTDVMKLDVVDLMGQIKENLAKKASGPAEGSAVSLPITTGAPAKELEHNLHMANKSCDISYDRQIASHRPSIIGRLLVKARTVLHEEIYRSVGPSIQRQTSFNSFAVKVLNEIVSKVRSLQKNLEMSERKTSELQTTVEKSRLDNLNFDYVRFENQFRGTEKDVVERQSVFLKFFENKKNVLDAGCGRGEFLSELSEHSKNALGVDSNPEMIGICRSKKLNVIETDALGYLAGIPDNSLGGIFSGQFVEHLTPKQLIEFISLCSRKLEKNAYFVAETVNPKCLTVFSQGFYMDLTHVKPVHPETIKFLLESQGFSDVAFQYFSPVPAESRLKHVNVSALSGEIRNAAETLNGNIDNLNGLLYGYQDYAVIARKT